MKEKNVQLPRGIRVALQPNYPISPPSVHLYIVIIVTLSLFAESILCIFCFLHC